MGEIPDGAAQRRQVHLLKAGLHRQESIALDSDPGVQLQPTGVSGRASRRSCMDDAESVVSVSFEGRGTAHWTVPPAVDIDGWVDAWYEPGSPAASAAYGTNLRQFLDGLAFGGAITLSIEVVRAGNLHHLYETIFRNLGDCVGAALDTARVAPGTTSGLAAIPRYSVEEL